MCRICVEFPWARPGPPEGQTYRCLLVSAASSLKIGRFSSRLRRLGYKVRIFDNAEPKRGCILAKPPTVAPPALQTWSGNAGGPESAVPEGPGPADRPAPAFPCGLFAFRGARARHGRFVPLVASSSPRRGAALEPATPTLLGAVPRRVGRPVGPLGVPTPSPHRPLCRCRFPTGRRREATGRRSAERRQKPVLGNHHGVRGHPVDGWGCGARGCVEAP